MNHQAWLTNANGTDSCDENGTGESILPESQFVISAIHKHTKNSFSFVHVFIIFFSFVVIKAVAFNHILII